MRHPESNKAMGRSGTNLPAILLAGSRGRMGSMLAERLGRAGYTVEGIELADEGQVDIPELLDRSRLVLLCVPVGAIRSCLAKLAPHFGPKHILMDITSVKALPMRWMEEAFDGAVVGAHPMFGPNPKVEDMRVALVRGHNARDADCAVAEELFRGLHCEVFWSGAKEHDSGVALAQSLNFAVSAAFLATLARHEGISPYLTPSFKRHKEAARMHLTSDTAMFLEFTAMNPEFPAAMLKIQETLREVAAGGLAGIAAEAAAWYTDPKG